MVSIGNFDQWRIQTMGHWQLSHNGDNVEIPRRVQRLVAFLALRPNQRRTHIAGVLWPETSEDRALSNLRTTIVLTRRTTPGLLNPDRHCLELHEGVGVDVSQLRSMSDLAHGPTSPIDRAHGLLAFDQLLPGWYDDWVLDERIELSARVIRALMCTGEQLLEQGELDLAFDVALRATQLEPLMETPHRMVVEVHLRNGDKVRALQVYQEFRSRSIREFGIAPSGQFTDLVAPLHNERRARTIRAVPG